MQAIKCEVCGSGDLIKTDGLFVCQHCGTKYSLEEARKLLGSVKIDKTDDTENYRVVARRALKDSDYERAMQFYDLILHNAPNDLEAVFYEAFCRVMICDYHTLKDRIPAFMNTVASAFELNSKNTKNDKDCYTIGDAMLREVQRFFTVQSENAFDVYKANRKNPDMYEDTCAANGVLYSIVKAYAYLEGMMKTCFPGEKKWIRVIQGNYYNYLDQYGKHCCKMMFLISEKKRLIQEIKNNSNA